MVRASLLAAASLAAALFAAAPAGAQDPPPPEPVIATGVTIAGVDVSGLTAAQATATLRVWFNQPITFRLQGQPVSVRPGALSSRARISLAVAAALAAAPDTALRLEVIVKSGALRRWLAWRARMFDREPVSTRAVLRGLQPVLSKPKPGRRLMTYYARVRLGKALRTHARALGGLPVKTLRPQVRPASHGPVVVIRRGSKLLTLYRPAGVGPMRVSASFPVATGRPSNPTPVGNFRIVTKQRNPWWYPPSAPWASGAKPIPPGPGNPLGTRWMGLNVGAVGIHGTPDAASIGYSASRGCIRMRISNAEWLFERVRVGTPVFIRSA